MINPLTCVFVISFNGRYGQGSNQTIGQWATSFIDDNPPVARFPPIHAYLQPVAARGQRVVYRYAVHLDKAISLMPGVWRVTQTILLSNYLAVFV